MFVACLILLASLPQYFDQPVLDKVCFSPSQQGNTTKFTGGDHLHSFHLPMLPSRKIQRRTKLPGKNAQNAPDTRGIQPSPWQTLGRRLVKLNQRYCIAFTVVLVGCFPSISDAQTTETSHSTTQIDWAMLESSANNVEGLRTEMTSTRESVFPIDPAIGNSSWNLSVNYLALRRADHYSFVFDADGRAGHSGGDHVENLAADWSNGLELQVDRHAQAFSDLAYFNHRRATVLYSEGSSEGHWGRSDGGSRLDLRTRYGRVELETGTRMEESVGHLDFMLGLRYAYLADDVEAGPQAGSSGAMPSVTPDSLSESASNHFLTPQLSVGGSWMWNRIRLNAEVTGGWGANLKSESFSDDNSGWTDSMFQQSSVAIGYEFNSRTQISLGWHHVYYQDVANVFRQYDYSSEGYWTEIGYTGGNIGLTHQF